MAYVQKLQKLSQITLDYAKPRLDKFISYAKVEMRPPTPSDIPLAAIGLAKLVKSTVTFKWASVPMKEAIINGVVTAEVVFWFFAGEIIGRRSFFGYSRIPGCYRVPGVFD